MEPEQNTQIAKIIYRRLMSNMKDVLDLEEFSYREKGRADPRFRTFKKHLMENTYETMRKIFEDLECLNLIQMIDYEEDVSGGYKDSETGGSGYINSTETDNFIKINKK